MFNYLVCKVLPGSSWVKRISLVGIIVFSDSVILVANILFGVCDCKNTTIKCHFYLTNFQQAANCRQIVFFSVLLRFDVYFRLTESLKSECMADTDRFSYAALICHAASALVRICAHGV